MAKLAFIFPGQGSQTVGMGKALVEKYSLAARTFSEADAALGYSISKLCFEGPADDLKMTANTQPAILTHSIAALRVLQAETGMTPDVVAGHSLGEFSALVCAGVISFEDAVRLVHLRGRFMQEAVPAGQGTMAALMGATMQQASELCQAASENEVVTPANYNGGQIVIAGHTAAVQRAIAKAKDFGVKRAVQLPVSAPFHCPLMEPAAIKLADQMKNVTFNNAKMPIVTNVEAKENSDGNKARQLLMRQVTSPVRWEESVKYLATMGVATAIEIGPGNVLAGLVKRIETQIDVKNVDTPEHIDALKN